MDTRLICLHEERHRESNGVLPKTQHSGPVSPLPSWLLNHYMLQTLGIHSTVRTESEDSGHGGGVVTESARERRGRERPPLGLTPRLTPTLTLILTPGLTLNPGLENPVNSGDTKNTGNIDMEAALQTRSR